MWHTWGSGQLHTDFWWGILKHIACLGDPGTDGTIILKEIFKKGNFGHGLDLSGSEQGQLAGCCKHDFEPSGFLK